VSIVCLFIALNKSEVKTYYKFLLNLIRRLQWEGKRPMWSLTIFSRYMHFFYQQSLVDSDLKDESNLSLLYVCHLLQILGLEICADTMVGDEMLRGISGGQRKRVTTGKI
jgi:hypothetical protein